ncbi:MAG: glucose 1-dehydrogenase [Deltaproteobacteria bacterium]|nr:MAG: glucose 1-dehydrogenase [Deltaproteobacteria bacterium]
MGKLEDKTALVTGGGRGIGRGIALEFAREGADVAINYRRDREAAEKTAAEVRTLGRRVVVLQADVSDREAVEAMVAEAVGFLGGLDIVVANAGVAARVAPVAGVDPAEWRRVLATDLDGAFWTARAAVPHVVARRGVLLFISSIGADLAGAGGAPYHVAKAGVNALMKVLAKEVAPAGVRVNSIAPGVVRSEMGERLLRYHGDAVLQTIPLGRAGEPSEIGRAAVFLASADGAWITGKILRVDGGAYI